jgi:hypothetical protein
LARKDDPKREERAQAHGMGTRPARYRRDGIAIFAGLISISMLNVTDIAVYVYQRM